MKTRHSTLSRHSKLVMQPRSATRRKNPRPFLRKRRATVDTIFIRRIGRSGRMRADRSGKRRMGHRMTVARPAPAPPSMWIASVSGGRRLACSGHARALHAPRCGRRASACAIRRNGGVPVAHDIAARRAFYPGRDRPPRNRASRGCGVEGGIGNRVIHAARRRRRCARSGHRARPPRRPARSRAAHAAESRSGNVRPLAILRSIKTPAASRSDRRPDARRRR